jgi:aminopeptidase N
MAHCIIPLGLRSNCGRTPRFEFYLAPPMTEQRTKFHLNDYKAPSFWQHKVDIRFRLFDDHTEVETISQLRFNETDWQWPQQVELMGENLELVSLEVNSKPWTNYEIRDHKLFLKDVPRDFELKIVTKIHPSQNKSMEGLYESKGLYCTQCESQGFRKITYFTDRPDNMAIYSTRIEARKDKYPYLLSNGNLIESGELGDGRHFATWNDPFKKPSYLFALVAGDLDMIEDVFITRSGKKVTLRVFANRGRRERCYHAMNSLKWSMKWDEDRFGLEYDLELFMIVAVDDFNFGAMENKGLNIYNSMAALADPKTADDQNFFRITSIVGHEYFHNWSGNRVTCRDWFQLSLKEGLTVYRDQEFTADLFSRPVQRLDDVTSLRERQFPEDAGPNAHPVRPESAYSTENFYTATIYEKGSELIRMIETIIGRENFSKGITKYFELYDGQAVTTEDFVRAMELASGADLKQFRLWYSQAGTPVVDVTGRYDASTKTYTLQLRQHTAPTPGQATKHALHIPVKVGLLSASGADLIPETVLALTQAENVFEFHNIHEAPLPSLFRDFSAPVKFRYDYSEQDDIFLLEKDSNHFNRWEAAQRLFSKAVLGIYHAIEKDEKPDAPRGLIEALGSNIEEAHRDPLFVSRLIQIPSFRILEQDLPTLNPVTLDRARQTLRRLIAHELEATLEKTFLEFRPKGDFEITPRAMGERMLMGSALAYLCSLEKPEHFDAALDLYSGQTMAEKSYALNALTIYNTSQAEKALAEFYATHATDGVLVNRWIIHAALRPQGRVAERLRKIMDDPHFDTKNPNNNRALWVGLIEGSPSSFHQKDASVYRLLADRILEIDAFNPNVGARLVGLLENWRKYTEPYASLMKTELEKIVAEPKLSSNTFELASNSLKGDQV